jgi:hypothetical protein
MSVQTGSLVAAALNKPQVYKFGYDLSGGYNKASMVIDIINKKGGSERSTDIGGKMQSESRGKNNVVQQIKTVTQSGNNIILTFIDPTYNKFIPKDVCIDTNYVLGRVIAAAPGTVTLQNYPDASTAMSATTQFQVGTLCKIMANISGFYGSAGTANRIFTPTPRYDYPSVVRASYTLTAGDKVETWIDTVSGSPFWYSMNEFDMVAQYFKQLEYKYIFSQHSAPVNSSLEGEVTGNRGIRQGIIQEGLYMPLSSVPTTTNLQDMITGLTDRDTTGAQEIDVWCGTQYLANFQNNITAPYIVATGVRNTFGGEQVKGINVMSYTFVNTTLNFMVLPLLNDSELSEQTTATGAKGTKWSNTAFFMNLSSIPVIGQNGNYIPALRKFHFGEEEMGYRGINGMISFERDAIGGGGKWVSTSSDIDAASIQMIGKQGLVGQYYRCGLMELTT